MLPYSQRPFANLLTLTPLVMIELSTYSENGIDNAILCSPKNRIITNAYRQSLLCL